MYENGNVEEAVTKIVGMAYCVGRVLSILFVATLAAILIALLIVGIASAETTPDEPPRVDFLQATHNGDGTVTWTYRIVAMHDVVNGYAFGLCPVVIDATPSDYRLGEDNETGLFGIAWDRHIDRCKHETITITIEDARWDEIEYAIIANNGIATGTVLGPICNPTGIGLSHPDLPTINHTFIPLVTK